MFTMTKHRHVTSWVTLFKNGRESIEDDPRLGRQIIQDNIIEAVRMVIMVDPHSAYNQIEAHTPLSHTTIFNIIH